MFREVAFDATEPHLAELRSATPVTTSAEQQVDEVLAAERRTLSPECRTHPICLDSYLAEDFHEYGASGIELTARVPPPASPTPLPLQLPRLRLNTFADSTSPTASSWSSTPPPAAAARPTAPPYGVTSEHGWQMFHHQGTPAASRPET